MNNVEFMKHLSLHMGMEIQTAMDITDLSQCRYCLKEFENAMLLQEHHEQVHTKSIEKYVCRICQTGFEDEKKFAHHMTQKHIRAELPYACYICNYRSSFQMDVIDHFLEYHERSDKMQCPRCLKIFSMSGGAQGYNPATAVEYLRHLEQHNQPKVFKCERCVLQFPTDATRKAHVEKDHVTWKDYETLEGAPMGDGEVSVRMPKPDERNVRRPN